MLRLPPANFDRASAVLEILTHEKSTTRDNSVPRIMAAVHDLWELPNVLHDVTKAPRSVRLRSAPNEAGVIDHPVPASHFARMLLSLPSEDLRAPYISTLLHQFGFFCLISRDEPDRLSMAGLAETMPPDWNGLDRYARYASVGICVGEPDVYSQEAFHNLLRAPSNAFYVYRLRTPSDKIFYIGKGEGLRALCHEKELRQKSFRTHTNWKKLNKIADILHSGKGIGYELESWHADETQAFLREDELILMAERENPWLLCNSNGRRWGGKPNSSFSALRTEWRMMRVCQSERRSPTPA